MQYLAKIIANGFTVYSAQHYRFSRGGITAILLTHDSAPSVIHLTDSSGADCYFITDDSGDTFDKARGAMQANNMQAPESFFALPLISLHDTGIAPNTYCD